MEPAVLLPLPQPTAVMAATAATAVTPARRLSLLLPASLVSERNLTLSHLRSRDDAARPCRASAGAVSLAGKGRRRGILPIWRLGGQFPGIHCLVALPSAVGKPTRY